MQKKAVSSDRLHLSFWETFVEVASVFYGLAALIVLLVSDVEALRAHHFLLAKLIAPACIVAPIGGWWAVYQCIRYERRPWRYIALVLFIPLGFVWYYFERYKKRESARALAAGCTQGTSLSSDRLQPPRYWEIFLEVASAFYGVVGVIVLWVSDPEVLRAQHFLMAILLTPGCIVAPIGGWWGVYQCVRYERKPWRYIALVVFIPLGFVTYYFERYKKREPAQLDPVTNGYSV